ncbi:MAG: hypothetical protein ACJA2O_004290 [Candidatus Azotimanducaceae bacterium]|jgi:hypothetical protein
MILMMRLAQAILSTEGFSVSARYACPALGRYTSTEEFITDSIKNITATPLTGC